MRTQDPERAEVTADQDGALFGRAIVPVDAIAPGEAPPENRGPVCKLVRGQGGCWGQAPGADVEPAGASQPWSYVPLIL